MERVSALRIELYDELQSLPEVLRSEFPDLAVDFLATVFRKSPAKPPSVPSDQLLRASAAPAFQLLSGPSGGGCSGDGAPPAQLAAVQSMLEAAGQEAARIEATASTMPPDGWGELEMPLERAAPASVRQQQPGGRVASPAATAAQAPAPALLVECQRCRKVLLACSSPEHQRQCMQQQQLADGGSLSDGPSSSEGVPAAAPSASRGSKRKRLVGAAAAASGGGAGKHSRPSHGGRRAASVEASPSLGEVAQGEPRQRHERRSAPPPVLLPAAPAPAKPACSAPPGSGPREPLSPTIRLTREQRRQRSQHPPRLPRRVLSIHPGRDLAEPLVLNAPAAHAAFDPAAGAAAAAAALAGAPVVMPLPAPGGTLTVGSHQDLPSTALAAAGPAAAQQTASGDGGWGAEQQAMLQWAMRPQGVAAQQAVPPAQRPAPPEAHLPAPQQGKQEPRAAPQQQAGPGAVQQQQQRQQADHQPQVLAQQTAQAQAQQQQQQQQQAKAQESCRIFNSLTLEQQRALREQLAKRKAAQQAAAQQSQAAGAPAAPGPRPPAGAGQQAPPRPALPTPQQAQQLYRQHLAAAQQQQQPQQQPLAGRPQSALPPGYVMAAPALQTTAAGAAAAAGVPGSLPLQLPHSASSSAMPTLAGQPLPGVFLAAPAGQPLPGALPTFHQAFHLQRPFLAQAAQQVQRGGAGGSAAAVPSGVSHPVAATVPGIAVGIPLPQANGAGMLAGPAPPGCFPIMPTQLPLRPSLPMYPSLPPMAASAGAATLGMQGHAAPGMAAQGMVPVGPLQAQQPAGLVQQAAQPSMQFVPAP